MDPYKRPCYEGKDPHLIEAPNCCLCGKSKQVERCLRCRGYWCCSKHRASHVHYVASFCSRLAEGINVLEQTIVPLRGTGVLSDDYREVERYLGMANQNTTIDQLAKHLHARLNLAQMYWEVAYEYEIQQVWEEALFHYLKVMKVEADCDLSTRVRVPLILLYLNRDDEAYAFIRSGLNERATGPSRPYPVEPNCRYLDIFKEIANSKEDEEWDFYLSHYVALAIIKMRIIASYDAISQSIEFAFQQTGLERIQEVRPIVRDMLVDCTMDIADQLRQLYQIFHSIQMKEPYQQDEPSFTDALFEYQYMSDVLHPAELDDKFRNLYECSPPFKITIESSLRCFYRVPGAYDMLRDFITGVGGATLKRKLCSSSNFEPTAKRWYNAGYPS